MWRIIIQIRNLYRNVDGLENHDTQSPDFIKKAIPDISNKIPKFLINRDVLCYPKGSTSVSTLREHKQQSKRSGRFGDGQEYFCP